MVHKRYLQVVIRFQICIFDTLNTARIELGEHAYRL